MCTWHLIIHLICRIIFKLILIKKLFLFRWSCFDDNSNNFFYGLRDCHQIMANSTGFDWLKITLSRSLLVHEQIFHHFLIFTKQNKTIVTLRIDPPVAVIFNQSHIRCSQIFEAIPEDFIIILGHDLFRNIFWKINIYPFKLTYDIIITFYLYVGYKTIKYNIILDASVYPIDIHCLNNENIYTFCFSFWNGQQISRPFSDFYPFFWVNTIFQWYAGQCFWLYFCFVRTNFSVFFDSAFHVTLTFFV